MRDESKHKHGSAEAIAKEGGQIEGDGPSYRDLSGESAYSALAAHLDSSAASDRPAWGDATEPGDGDEGDVSAGRQDARPAGHEEGLSVDPDELGRTFLQDATEARAVAADDRTEVRANEEVATHEVDATDHDRRGGSLPTHESDAEEDLYPAFDAYQVQQVYRRDEGLYMRWQVAASRGELRRVTINGHPYTVIRNRELARRLEQAEPQLDGYLFDVSSQQIMLDEGFA